MTAACCAPHCGVTYNVKRWLQQYRANVPHWPLKKVPTETAFHPSPCHDITLLCISIHHHAGIRQLLAHANQLLEAAAAEPQWLRSGERRFRQAPWTKLVAAAQLVALR